MFLPIGYKIGQFAVTAQVEKSKAHCIYEVSSEFGKIFYAVEFYPEDICRRDEETGYLIAADEKQAEYRERLKSFTDTINILKSSGNSQLIRIYRTIREDRDNYICLYHKSDNKPLAEYLAGQSFGKISYKQAYEILLSLTEALSKLSGYGLYFKIGMENLYINAFGSVEHVGFIQPDYQLNYVVEDVSAVYYMLVTGKKYSDALCRPSEAGAMLPKSLDNLIFESLSYNTVYESLSEYLSKIKDSVLFDTDMAAVAASRLVPPEPLAPAAPPPVYGPDYSRPDEVPPAAPAPAPVQDRSGPYQAPVQPGFYPPPIKPAPSRYGPAVNGPVPPYGAPPPGTYMPPPKKSSGSGKFIAGCFVGAFIVFIIMLIVIIGIFNSMRYSNYGYATSEVLYDDYLGEDYEYDFEYDGYYDEYDIPISYTAHVSYWNEEVTLENTVYIHNGYAYYRSYMDDSGWVLAKSPLDSLNDRIILAYGVMPAYITIQNGRVYFSDALEDYHIKSVSIDEADALEVQTHNSFRSASIVADGDYIYFVNLEDGGCLYSLQAEDMMNTTMRLTDNRAYRLIDLGDRIIYDSEIGAYVYDKSTGISMEVSEDYIIMGSMTMDRGEIYYLDLLSESVKRLDLDNGDSEEVYNADVYYMYQFDIEDGSIYYMDYDNYTLLRVHLETGEQEDLGLEATYFSIHGGMLFYYDSSFEALYAYDIHTGDNWLLMDTPPDYYEGF